MQNYVGSAAILAAWRARSQRSDRDEHSGLGELLVNACRRRHDGWELRQFSIIPTRGTERYSPNFSGGLCHAANNHAGCAVYFWRNVGDG